MTRSPLLSPNEPASSRALFVNLFGGNGHIAQDGLTRVKGKSIHRMFAVVGIFKNIVDNVNSDGVRGRRLKTLANGSGGSALGVGNRMTAIYGILTLFPSTTTALSLFSD